jgi:hypothetical protein
MPEIEHVGRSFGLIESSQTEFCGKCKFSAEILMEKCGKSMKIEKNPREKLTKQMKFE